MYRTILYLIAFTSFFLIGYYFFPQTKTDYVSVKRAEIILGTLVEIQIDSCLGSTAESILTEAFNEIKRIDTLFSTYNPNSEISNFNKSSDSIINVTPEVYYLIEQSLKYGELSGGAFDISLNNLIDLWGIEKGYTVIPAEKEIKALLFHSGIHNISLLNNNKIRKRNQVQLNLSSIAKGYAVDRASEVLKNAGIKKCYINAGGEIRVIGNNWLIGIQHPRDAEKLSARININNRAMATSGDYENYFQIGNRYYHHILNPKTGFPSEGVQSVTILAKTVLEADALSTAIMVMGVIEGIKLIESLPGIDALIIDSAGIHHVTKNFPL